MARSAADAALLLSAMAGFDERDSTSIDHPVPDYVAGLGRSLQGLRVGVVTKGELQQAATRWAQGGVAADDGHGDRRSHHAGEDVVLAVPGRAVAVPVQGIVARNEGVEAVRVEPLARALGVTKGSFYWHFADRQALDRTQLVEQRRGCSDGAVGRLDDGHAFRQPTFFEILKKDRQCVVEHGQISQADLAEVARRTTVFALPSFYEGLPLVLVEALACGCPVVSTDCPSGPAEILERGRYGRLVPVGDAAALAQAILAALDPAVRRAAFQLAEQAAGHFLNAFFRMFITEFFDT